VLFGTATPPRAELQQKEKHLISVLNLSHENERKEDKDGNHLEVEAQHLNRRVVELEFSEVAIL
jgi:hypothetical protein